MEGEREVNGEYINAGYRCGRWGSFTAGITQGPRVDKREGEATVFTCWIHTLIREVFSSLS